MGEDAAFGRKVKGVKVFAEDSADYLGLLLTRYQQQRGSRDVVRRVRERARRRAAGAIRGAGRRVAMSTPRAVPFYCPFCGEQDLRPDDAGRWRCESCERAFELTVTRIGG